jgi:hypothetical protein
MASSGSRDSSREGPTILWTMLKGKKAKSNDRTGFEPSGEQYTRDF